MNGDILEINALVEDLTEGFFGEDTTCVIYKDGVIFEHTGGSIAPIVDAWFCGDLEDAVVVDKVIGKASAMFMKDGGAAFVHGRLMSEPAADFLRQQDLPFSMDRKTEKIINRAGDGLCPMESVVMDTDDLTEGIEKVFSKMKEMGMILL